MLSGGGTGSLPYFTYHPTGLVLSHGPLHFHLHLRVSHSSLISSVGLMVPWQPLFPGSVSVGVWQMACRRVIKVGEYTVKNIIGEQFITGFITKYSRRLRLRSCCQRCRRSLWPCQWRREPVLPSRRNHRHVVTGCLASRGW